MRPLIFSLTPVVAIGLGWLLGPQETQNISSLSNSERQGEASIRVANPSGKRSAEPKQTDLGAYRIQENGQRVYAGLRDVSLLENASRGLPNDLSAFSEMMSQLSQMSDRELADAWADLSKQAPREGEGSVLVASYVLTRLQAAGQEVVMPPAWAKFAQELSPALEADAVRRDPAKYLALLESGKPLSSTQRESLLQQLAKENPGEATRLWLEHSNLEQLTMESGALAGLMGDPATRNQLLSGLETKVTDSKARERILSGLLRTWAFTDREQFESFASGLTDPALKEVATISLLRAYHQFDPEKGVSYAQNLEGSLREFAIGQSISILSAENLDRAKELAQTMDDPADRLAAVRSLSYEMASQNYEEYQEWREQLPPHEKEAVIQESFALYAGHEIDEAVDWLNAQPEGLDKEILKTQLMRVYVADHPESVLGLLASFDHPHAKRNAAAIALQNSDPSNISAVRDILTVANDQASGVNLSLPPGARPSPLAAGRVVPHSCSNCGKH